MERGCAPPIRGSRSHQVLKLTATTPSPDPFPFEEKGRLFSARP
jgi:hypothetical protein